MGKSAPAIGALLELCSRSNLPCFVKLVHRHLPSSGIFGASIGQILNTWIYWIRHEMCKKRELGVAPPFNLTFTSFPFSTASFPLQLKRVLSLLTFYIKARITIIGLKIWIKACKDNPQLTSSYGSRRTLHPPLISCFTQDVRRLNIHDL